MDQGRAGGGGGGGGGPGPAAAAAPAAGVVEVLVVLVLKRLHDFWKVLWHVDVLKDHGGDYNKTTINSQILPAKQEGGALVKNDNLETDIFERTMKGGEKRWKKGEEPGQEHRSLAGARRGLQVKAFYGV